MPTTTPEQTLAHLRDTLLGKWAVYTDDIVQAVDNLTFHFDETESLASFFEQWQDQEHIKEHMVILPLKEEETPTPSEDLIWKIKM